MKRKNIPLILVLMSLAGCGGGGGPDGQASSASASMLHGMPGSASHTAPTGTTPASASPAVDSRQFLMDAYQDGLGEIELSRLALQKSTNEEVRTFAQAMVDQHFR